MAKPLALIVDDEPDIRELLKITLSRMKVEVVDVESVADAIAALGTHSFNLCLTDMRLQDGDGIELVEHIQQHYSEVPVAVITAFGSMELAINALKVGAFDFVAKPIELKVLRDLVNTALRLSHHVELPEGKASASKLLGVSSAIENLRHQIGKLARSQAPVHISGQSGVGKELVARMIHEQGARAEHEFVPVNCGAIPADLMESEFFGHKKGSFTGAVSDKQGLFQAADGGTLFLDEVADLPLDMQVKLLRAIQEKAIRAVGDQREINVDVRLLSATHQDLGELVAQGKFRQDLYYRINVIELKVPPLSERTEDIPILAEHILAKLSAGKTQNQSTLAPEALDRLCQYHFPGNIRELENILERAQTLCEDNIIRPADMQLQNQDVASTQASEQPTVAEQTNPDKDVSLDNYLGDVEVQKIKDALEQTRWNKTQAAKLLGITTRALRYRLQKLGIK